MDLALEHEDSATDDLMALGVAFLVCDTNLCITAASTMAAELLGVSSATLTAQPLTDVCLPLVGNEAHLQAICQGHLSHLTIEQINLDSPDGKPRYVSLVVLPQETEPGLMIILSDVTLQSRQQQRLQQQHHELLLLHEHIAEQNARLIALNAELEQVSQRKSDLMAIVTHDLRSPLTTIIGYADMLLEAVGDPLSPEQRELVESIRQQGHSMRDLLGRLLDLRRLESTELQECSSIHLNLLLLQLFMSFQDHARLAAIDLQFSEHEEDVLLSGDKDILQQAVANLLSNAIKYTAAGGTVQVHVQRLDTLPALEPPLEPAANWCAIEVRDSGAGIAAEDLARIFDPFFRTSAARNRGLAGSGLGLTIVQMAVRQHHGRILVDSRLNEGTTFTLLLPCDPPSNVKIADGR